MASKLQMSGSQKMEHEPHATNVFVNTYNNSSIKRVTRKFHVVVVQQETAKKCTI